MLHLSLLLDAAPTDWITKDTLLNFAGATSLVVVFTVVFQRIFKKHEWSWAIALILAELISFLRVYVRGDAWSRWYLPLAILNGLWLYVAAVGINNIFTTLPPAAQQARKQIHELNPYRWWP